MSPQLMGRRLSLLFTLLAMVVSMFGTTMAPAQAAGDYRVEPMHRETFTYDCLQGQTVGVNPAEMHSMVTDPETGASSPGGSMFWLVRDVVLTDGTHYDEGVAPEPGTSSYDFGPVHGLPLTPSKTIYVDRYMQHDGDFAEYEPSTWWCEGEPTDTDDDDVPDELDACPEVASDEPDGCPPLPGSPVLNVVSTTPAHDGMSDGSITVTVTNPVDKVGTPVSYDVLLGLTVIQAGVGPLADGETSSAMTVSSQSGTFSLCANGDDDTTGCIDVIVPRDPTQALAGKATFQNRCRGIYTRLTNNGWKSGQFVIEYWSRSVERGRLRKVLAPGESMSLLSGRYFYLRAVAYREGGSAGDTVLGRSRWTVPDDCVPMVGGAKVVSWGKKLTKRRSTPVVTVRTEASHTKLGVQWARGSNHVDWRRTVSPGKHSLRLFPVKHHSKRCFRVWAAYTDGLFTVGEGPVSKWRCYWRP